MDEDGHKPYRQGGACPAEGGIIITFRQALVAAVVILIASVSLATAGTVAREEVKPIGQLIWEHADPHARSAEHPQRLPLPPADPVLAAKHAITMEPRAGRTVAEWLDSVAAPRLLSLRGEPREADLATEVLRISALVGVEQDSAAIRASALEMPDAWRAPFASLVATVADAYEAQLTIAGVEELSIEQRDASIARAEAIVGALNDFRAATAGLPAPRGAPVFADPEGLVVLGAASDDTWTRSGAIADPVLLVDLAGDDEYQNSAGGACVAPIFHACNLLALSVVADLDGDDSYVYDGAPSAVQGSGSLGGVGILVDLAGDDSYFSRMTRTTSGPSGAYRDGVAQGGSNAGVGILLDAAGSDVYQADAVSANAERSIWNFAQGFAGFGGFAALVDGDGADTYFANTHGVMGPGLIVDFVGLYTNGVGFYGGVGVQVDAGATNDVYRAHAEAQTTDYYAQGFGAFGGSGIFFEDGGDDDYAAGHRSFNPFIQPLLNCAFGTGSIGGAGYFLELGGNDIYLGYSYADTNGGPGSRYAYTMNEGFGGPAVGYGLFVDVSGDDGHFMEAYGGTKSDTFGRGVLLEHGQFVGLSLDGTGGGNHAGNYLDLGGNDVYTGAPPSGDGKTWSGGADLNLVPSAALLAVLG